MVKQVKLLSNERVITTGKTGSGKTFLMSYMTKTLNRLVVLDGKGTLNQWSLEPWSREGERRLKAGEPVRLRAMVPYKAEPGPYWDKILEACFDAGNVTIYIDELYAIVPPNQQASNILWACYTRGREFGVGVWACTQRPTWIPLVALSESEHYFMFRLSLDEDRRRMAAFMGSDVLKPITDEHGFYYCRAEWDNAIYYKQLEVKHKSNENQTLLKPINQTKNLQPEVN